MTTYCRPSVDSDVLVVRTENGRLLCHCGDEDGLQATEQGMLDHLLRHLVRAEKVPARVLDQLREENDHRKEQQ